MQMQTQAEQTHIRNKCLVIHDAISLSIEMVHVE